MIFTPQTRTEALHLLRTLLQNSYDAGEIVVFAADWREAEEVANALMQKYADSYRTKFFLKIKNVTIQFVAVGDGNKWCWMRPQVAIAIMGGMSWDALEQIAAGMSRDQKNPADVKMGRMNLIAQEKSYLQEENECSW